MIKNLCYSYKKYKWSQFVTFTCNKKKHFGISPIKQWIDGEEWKKIFHMNLSTTKRKEIKDALFQS